MQNNVTQKAKLLRTRRVICLLIPFLNFSCDVISYDYINFCLIVLFLTMDNLGFFIFLISFVLYPTSRDHQVFEIVSNLTMEYFSND